MGSAYAKALPKETDFGAANHIWGKPPSKSSKKEEVPSEPTSLRADYRDFHNRPAEREAFMEPTVLSNAPPQNKALLTNSSPQGTTLLS